MSYLVYCEEKEKDLIQKSRKKSQVSRIQKRVFFLKKYKIFKNGKITIFFLIYELNLLWNIWFKLFTGMK